MYLVGENLYLGDISDANGIKVLQNREIKYILTLDITPLPSEITQNFTTKFVEIEDLETADILSKIDNCLAFLNESLEKGKVLVHCYAGVSRSACIVVAFLMKEHQLSLLEAEEKLRNVKQDIEINKGFIHQLLLFEVMGWKVDKNHPAYKQHHFRMLKYQIESGGHEQLSSEFIANNPNNSNDCGENVNCIYKCKKCRKPVFQQNNIYPHEIDETKAFRTKTSETISSKCSSYFLEPIKWMEKSIVAKVTGKLDCPYCNFRLGRFNWSGARCSCGNWVTPALQIHASNVDKTDIN